MLGKAAAWAKAGADGEQLQRLLPGGPPDMFICGNDDEAKRQVAGLLDEFGWSVVLVAAQPRAGRGLEDTTSRLGDPLRRSREPTRFAASDA